MSKARREAFEKRVLARNKAWHDKAKGTRKAKPVKVRGCPC